MRMKDLRSCRKMLNCWMTRCGKATQDGIRLSFLSSINGGIGAAKCFSTTLTNTEIREKRNKLFNQELERQQSLVTRIEKIEVRHAGIPEECTLAVNKRISTPLDCARHIHELLTQRSVIAEVNGQLWDMHRPLEENCNLRFLHFKDEDPRHVNQAFWRSCCFMLGLVLDKAFKDDICVVLHSWPKPNIWSGYFAHDAFIDVDDWVPRADELRVLTGMFRKLASEGRKFERLEVEASVATKIFEDNAFKCSQIPAIASQSATKTVTLYRLDDHIDISRGPMIANTSQLSMIQVVAMNSVTHSSVTLSRFRGVALPKQLPLNHFAWGILVDRAKKSSVTLANTAEGTDSGTETEENDQQTMINRPGA